MSIEDNGVPGGLRRILEAQTPSGGPQYTVVLLLDQGFKKFGFDRANRRSFPDILHQIKTQSNGRFHFFLPLTNSDVYLDRNFNRLAAYQNLPPGRRHRARTANSSAVTCTKARWHVECTFAREFDLQITGTRKEIPRQYMEASTINGFQSQPKIYIWLSVVDVVSKNFSAPFHLSYPLSQYDTYHSHGIDLRNRIEMENPLSEYNNVTFSRNIFRKPVRQEFSQEEVLIE